MDGLQLASKYWNLECRDTQIRRLQKQKGAAHTQALRLTLRMYPERKAAAK